MLSQSEYLINTGLKSEWANEANEYVRVFHHGKSTEYAG